MVGVSKLSHFFSSDRICNSLQSQANHLGWGFLIGALRSEFPTQSSLFSSLLSLTSNMYFSLKAPYTFPHFLTQSVPGIFTKIFLSGLIPTWCLFLKNVKPRQWLFRSLTWQLKCHPLFFPLSNFQSPKSWCYLKNAKLFPLSAIMTSVGPSLLV